MKRFAPLLLLLSLALVVVVPYAWAAGSPQADRSPGAPVATAVSTVTGVAISPLLGTGAYGAYKWVVAKDDATRLRLPWYAQPKFWVPALLLVLLVAAKDTIGAGLSAGWKKPLDVLETIENKISGLIAAGAVIPFALEAMSELLAKPQPLASGFGANSSGLATISLGAIDPATALQWLSLPFALAVFAVVWLASHAIHVLILLSPWGAIDAALKVSRTALLGLVTLTAMIDPWVGAALSLVVIVVAYFVCGWAFRLTTFGTLFSWEFITRRCLRFTPAEESNAMFAGSQLPDVPVRTYGRLVKDPAGQLQFVYRRWLVGQTRATIVPAAPQELAVGHGALFSDIVDRAGGELFTLPPRYRGHEHALARAYGLSGVREAGLRKAWSAMRELFVGAAAPEPAPASPVSA